MNIFRSRKTAIAVTAVCVLASTILGSHRSLAAVRRGVEATIDQGADGSGFSIGNDLSEACAIAANLHTVAGKYIAQTHSGDLESLLAAREKLEKAKTTAEKKAAFQTLSAQCRRVQQALSGLSGVSEADRTYLSGFRVDLEAIADTIQRDPYNDLAREFNDQTLKRFPASVLGKLTGVKPLETFD